MLLDFLFPKYKDTMHINRNSCMGKHHKGNICKYQKDVLMSYKKTVLKNLTKFTGKYLRRINLNNVSGLQLYRKGNFVAAIFL